MKKVVWTIVILGVLAIFWVIGSQTDEEDAKTNDEQTKPTMMNNEEAQVEYKEQKERNDYLSNLMNEKLDENYEGQSIQKKIEEFRVDEEKGIITVYAVGIPKDEAVSISRFTGSLWAMYLEKEFQPKTIQVYIDDAHVFSEDDPRFKAE